MAQFSPRPSQSTFNPANAFRPPRTMVNSQGETSRRIVAGQRAESAAQSQEIAGSLDAITGSSDRLRGRLERMMARQSQIDEAARREADDLAARAAARQMKRRARRAAMMADQHGLADGSDAHRLFQQGGVTPEGEQFNGVQSDYNEITEGMSPGEIEAFDKIVNPMLDNFTLGIDEMEIKKQWGFAKDNVQARLEENREDIVTNPSWDAFVEYQEAAPDELALVMTPDSQAYNDALKEEQRGLTFSYMNGLLNQGEVSFGTTGAHVLKEHLKEGSFKDALDESEVLNFKKAADRAIEQWQQQTVAEVKADIAENIQHMAQGAFMDYAPDRLDVVGTFDPELAEDLNKELEYAWKMGADTILINESSIPRIAERTSEWMSWVEEATKSQDPHERKLAMDYMHAYQQMATDQLKYRAENPAGWLGQNTPVFAEREANMAGMILNGGTPEMLASGAGQAIAQRESLRAKRKSQELAYEQEPSIFSKETMDAFASRIRNITEADDGPLFMSNMRQVTGPLFADTVARLAASHEDIGVISIAGDFVGEDTGRHLWNGWKRRESIAEKWKNNEWHKNSMNLYVDQQLADYRDAVDDTGWIAMREAITSIAYGKSQEPGVDIKAATEWAAEQVTQRYQILNDTAVVDLRRTSATADQLETGIGRYIEEMKPYAIKTTYGVNPLDPAYDIVADQNFYPQTNPGGDSIFISSLEKPWVGDEGVIMEIPLDVIAYPRMIQSRRSMSKEKAAENKRRHDEWLRGVKSYMEQGE